MGIKSESVGVHGRLLLQHSSVHNWEEGREMMLKWHLAQRALRDIALIALKCALSPKNVPRGMWSTL